ncbi:hypothetical protein A4R26_04685 [Niastella populi]|uniref:Uncharacterized protein n=1 Tax=Niastella populi TaxID=550983 RepID=A0A1V9FDU5_9BACT|nr:hypothetical protein A4R26_04685 [Niastella populi]
MLNKSINIFFFKMNNKIKVPGSPGYNVYTHCYTALKHIGYIRFIEYICYFLKKCDHTEDKLLQVTLLSKKYRLKV